MRTSKATIDEIEAAEKAVDARRNSRANGFSMMAQRDAGYVRLTNGVGMRWRTVQDSRPLQDGEARTVAPPDNTFGLDIRIDGKTHHFLFDAEEFRKHLRWV